MDANLTLKEFYKVQWRNYKDSFNFHPAVAQAVLFYLYIKFNTYF